MRKILTKIFSRKAGLSYFQICNLVLAVVAFSFLIGMLSGSVGVVDAYEVGDWITLNQAPGDVFSGGERVKITQKISENYFKVQPIGGPEGYINKLRIVPSQAGGSLPAAAPPTAVEPTAVTAAPVTAAPGTSTIALTGENTGSITQTLANTFNKQVILTPGQEVTLKALGPNEYRISAGNLQQTLDTKGATEIASKLGMKVPESQFVAPPQPFGLNTGYFFGHIIQGVLWAVIAYSAIQLLGNLFGMEKETVDALSAAAALGTFAGKFTTGTIQGLSTQWGMTKGWLGMSYGGWIGLGAGIIVGLIVFEMMYKKESKKIVTFTIEPWEAPSGGQNCEKCNSDMYACSEYRCKALGQACELLNPGTGKEKCAWVHKDDVNSPIIQTWKDVLTKEHDYIPDTAIRPPDRGVKIASKASDKCIKAFTPLEFGITLNEPAQCKIDYNRTSKFDEMAYYFGGSNIYKYNHSQILRLPGPDSINAEAPELKADGTYSLFVRCRDANGNANDDLFVFNFCVEKGPDVTAPKIEATSIANNMPVQFGLNETPIEIYVNEPADCKWSKLDMGYNDMENSMICSQHVWEMNNLMLYKCTTTLTGLIDRQDNNFYFKCRDQPWLKDSPDRITNTESYVFTLKGTQHLNIGKTSPNETIKGYTSPVPVYLEVETENGYNFGDSWCSYSLTGSSDDWIQMYETGSQKHKQRLDLPAGNYFYYFQCVDLGGNSAISNATFNVEVDVNPPVVVRAYNDAGKLKILTDEKSTCGYSTNTEKKCNFQVSEGTNMPYANSTEHFAEWVDDNNYYIKCQDINGRQPNPTDCSIIVKARI